MARKPDAEVTDADILQQLEIWFTALKDWEDAEKITALYASDAVLVPTLWNGPCFGKTAIRNYFEAEFQPAHPDGYMINYAISRMGDIAINSGHYVFVVDDPKAVAAGKDCRNKEHRVKKHARYTFVYRKVRDRWEIVSHHSSKMPEEHSAEAIRWVQSDCVIGASAPA